MQLIDCHLREWEVSLRQKSSFRNLMKEACRTLIWYFYHQPIIQKRIEPPLIFPFKDGSLQKRRQLDFAQCVWHLKLSMAHLRKLSHFKEDQYRTSSLSFHSQLNSLLYLRQRQLSNLLSEVRSKLLPYENSNHCCWFALISSSCSPC